MSLRNVKWCIYHKHAELIGGELEFYLKIMIYIIVSLRVLFAVYFIIQKSKAFNLIDSKI